MADFTLRLPFARSLVNHVYSRDGCKTIYGSSSPDGEQPSGDAAEKILKCQTGKRQRKGKKKGKQLSAGQQGLGCNCTLLIDTFKI